MVAASQTHCKACCHSYSCAHSHTGRGFIQYEALKITHKKHRQIMLPVLFDTALTAFA